MIIDMITLITTLTYQWQYINIDTVNQIDSYQYINITIIFTYHI